jgi:thioredoxin reductase
MKADVSVDVLIVGGGPAGLNAALVLGGARRSVVVVDEELARNRVTLQTHGFLTRDGTSPGELRKIATEQLKTYPSVTVLYDTVTDITGKNGAFTAQTTQGIIITSKKVIFATGMKDLFPAIDGLAETYGKSTFACPYCDGWDLRDQQLILIVRSPRILPVSKLIKGWTPTFYVCTNGPDEIGEQVRAELAQHELPLHESPIARVESEDGQVSSVLLEDGTQLPCTGIFWVPNLVQGTSLPEKLGCRLTATGILAIDSNGCTTVPGVFAAGDNSRDGHQLIYAASAGATAAISINGNLAEEVWAGNA